MISKEMLELHEELKRLEMQETPPQLGEFLGRIASIVSRMPEDEKRSIQKLMEQNKST